MNLLNWSVQYHIDIMMTRNHHFALCCLYSSINVQTEEGLQPTPVLWWWERCTVRDVMVSLAPWCKPTSVGCVVDPMTALTVMGYHMEVITTCEIEIIWCLSAAFLQLSLWLSMVVSQCMATACCKLLHCCAISGIIWSLVCLLANYFWIHVQYSFPHQALQ